MCTAITFQNGDYYFGRTLDYDISYQEQIVIMPRGYGLSFRSAKAPDTHYAIIGMAHVANDYPLYFDAANEKGLCIAALNFSRSAQYHAPNPDKENVGHFELIPWLLGQCATTAEAVALLEKTNLAEMTFSEALPPAMLHWLLDAPDGCITLESTKDGFHIYPNQVGVLTNEPPFPQQMLHLSNFMHLTPEEPTNSFSDQLKLEIYSRGMGAIGLPGDLSSQSRFVRAAFTKLNSLAAPTEAESVNQFFHILSTVSQTRGCCRLKDGANEITLYSSCCNATNGIYYYTTYDNPQINAVHLHGEDLNSSDLYCFPLNRQLHIFHQNS